MKGSQAVLTTLNRDPSRRSKGIRWGIVAITSVGFMMGCSESKVAQCNRLIDIANQAAQEVESVTQSANADDPAAFRSVANAADQAATELETIELSDSTLEGYKQRFISLYAETSEATQALVDAVEQQDTQAATAAYERLEMATQKESPLVEEVNAYCQGSA